MQHAYAASWHCRPCVASISGGMADVLDNTCAKMVALGNGFVERFRDAMLDLYLNERLRAEMGEKARKRALCFPGMEQYFKKFCSCADRFISRKDKDLC